MVRAACSVLFLCFFLMEVWASPARANEYPWLSPGDYNSGQTIEQRITPPEGFKRVPVQERSFAKWLRGLPLMTPGSPVHIYPVSEGRLKRRQDVHLAVVDMDVLRFQECADAVIRLRAEYLWCAGRAEEACFKFTSGDLCCWERWRNGWRPSIIQDGTKVVWIDTGRVDNSREESAKYLDKVMEFAGTASLSRELAPVTPNEIGIGDVIVQGGSPGHAVLVLDMVSNEDGDRMMLLGQSYMPAQEFHVLKNPQKDNLPWYKADFGDYLETPEWTFDKSHCRSFGSQKTAPNS